MKPTTLGADGFLYSVYWIKCQSHPETDAPENTIKLKILAPHSPSSWCVKLPSHPHHAEGKTCPGLRAVRGKGNRWLRRLTQGGKASFTPELNHSNCAEPMEMPHLSISDESRAAPCSMQWDSCQNPWCSEHLYGCGWRSFSDTETKWSQNKRS